MLRVNFYIWLLGFFFIQEEMKTKKPIVGAAIWGSLFTGINVLTVIRFVDVFFKKMLGYEGLNFSAYVFVCIISAYVFAFFFYIKLNGIVFSNSFQLDVNSKNNAKRWSFIYVIFSVVGLMLSYAAVM